MTQDFSEDEYTKLLMTEAYSSYSEAAFKFTNASMISCRLWIALTVDPPQRSPWGKVLRSNLVTTPKLLEPPFKADHRSGFSFEFAFTTWPFASAISKFSTLSHANPNRGAKNDIPPADMNKNEFGRPTLSQKNREASKRINLDKRNARSQSLQDDLPPRTYPATPTSATLPPDTERPIGSKFS